MIDFGIVRPGTTLYIPFATYDSNDPAASVTLTGLAVTDIEIYKNGSVTQRSSDAGYALLDTDGIDFDAVTGIHGFSIDLADNTDAGFYSAGAQYWVVVASVTVDAGTVNFIAATFRIGLPQAVLNTTIATLATQTSFTLTAGPAEDDALNGCAVYIHDVASAVQGGYAIVSDYTGSTKTVTLVAGTTFTAAATDNISVFPPALQPTVWGRTLDVSAGGEAGLDWGNVGSKTTTNDLTGTTIATTQKVDVETIKTQAVTLSGGVTIPAATLASTTNITAATGVTLTATTGLGNQTANITGNLSGSVGSVTGAVGSVTGLTAATVHSDLDDIQARLPAALTAGGNIKADALAIDGSTTAATNLKQSATVIYVGSVTGAATTTTLVDSGLTQADTDHWKGRIIIFLTGSLKYQATDITAFTPATDTLTFTALTNAPAGADTYVVL